ncbi:MAG: hypothetical protein FJZ56_06645 [Chlamydiae bacterium]|nr:hypothetical protein [Chlamydiota bacterium]
MFYRFFFIILTVIAVACQKQPDVIPKETKPVVLVSIPPYATIVKQVAGDTVEVVSITDEDSDPHIFEPKPRMTNLYKNARLWIGVGEPFEKKLLEKFQSIDPSMEFVDLTTKVPLLTFNQEIPQKHTCKHCKKQKDRHIWLSPLLVVQQAQIIASYLSDLHPENKEIYAKNLYELNQQLHILNGQLQNQLAPYHNKAILVSHPAFGYFCYQYGIVQLAVSADEQEQVKPQDLTDLCMMMEEFEVLAIVIEPHDNIKSIQSVCNLPNLPYKKINSIALDYIQTMHDLADLISGASGEMRDRDQ